MKKRYWIPFQKSMTSLDENQTQLPIGSTLIGGLLLRVFLSDRTELYNWGRKGTVLWRDCPEDRGHWRY